MKRLIGLAAVACLVLACAETGARNENGADVTPDVPQPDLSRSDADLAGDDPAVDATDAPPSCAITTPTDGALVPDSAAISLVAQVGDDRDAPASLSVTWRSDVAGALGSVVPESDGTASLDAELDLGVHRLDLLVVDSAGLDCGAGITVTVGHDGDLDAHVGVDGGGGDCDDDDPSVYPGAIELCDGVANDCDGPADEGVITDGAGCQDPGAPSFPAEIDVLHITLRTADVADAGTDGNAVSVCLTADDCFSLNNPNYNDFEQAAVDVFSFEGVGLARSDVDRVEIRTSGSDAWTPACLDLRFDGEPVYCNDAIGETFDGETAVWQDPSGLTVACPTCFDRHLTHGPMVGATGPDRTRLWLRADATRQIVLRVAANEADLATVAPVAYRYPAARDDLTAIVDVEGLTPDTTYYYDLEIETARSPVLSFRTAPADGPVEMSLAFGSCTRWDEQPIFAQIDALTPDLFLFIGDNHYGNTNDLSDLRQYYRWALEVPERAALARQTPTVAIWDDHDFVGNNTSGDAPGKERALRAFSEYWANPSYGTDEVPGVFFTHRYGDIELFALDDRYWRGLDGSILGDEQTGWLERALLASDATFKLIASGSQWTTEGSDDSWAFFPAAQQSLLRFIAGNNIDGVVLLSGDVHRSELRLLPGARGGYSIPELVSSPLANSNFGCSASNELLACWDDGRYVVTIAIDTTLDDPLLVATVLDETATVLTTWEIRASELTNPGFVPVSPDARRDIDGDGYADLVVGVPGENSGAGLVHVLHGSSLGLRTLGSAVLSQNSPGVPGGSEAGDALGATVAMGDFNNDGLADVAVGAPGEAIGSESGAGLVAILIGTLDGLNGGGSFNLHQNSTDVPDTSEAGDQLGAALAIGDFDGNGFDDLAVGAPGEGSGRGVVHVFYGSATGLNAIGSNQWDQSDTDAPTAVEAGDLFGAALAAGDFDGDGFDDLAIGAPGEAIGEVNNSGHVTVLFGSGLGLNSAATQAFHQGTPDVADAVEADDLWGAALAAGDFDGNGRDDLAIGSPGEALGDRAEAGRVSVLYGSDDGLAAAGSQNWQLDILALEAAAEDGFGQALAPGDVNGDGYDDLAIGAPGRSVDEEVAAGAVFVLLGGPAGLTEPVADFDQDASRWMGAEAGDGFGAALSIGDYNADGYGDLAIGAPDEDLSAASNAGAVLVFFGSEAGLVPLTDQRWHQSLRRVAGEPEAADRFGAGLPQ